MDSATAFKCMQFKLQYPKIIKSVVATLRENFKFENEWDYFEELLLKKPAIVPNEESFSYEEYVQNVTNWVFSEAQRFLKKVEEEEIKENKNEGQSPHIIVPYSLIVKYLAEIIGIGDADDFAERVAKINRFIDNKEAHLNAQRLSSLQKVLDLENGKTEFTHGAKTIEEAIKGWQGGADIAENMLVSDGLKVFTPSELDEAFIKGKYLTGKDGVSVFQDASKAVTEYSKKGQKYPFRNFELTNHPRQGVEKATKKFNKTKDVLDVLSNAKLNAILSLLLTPTPLYEKSYIELQKEKGLDKKLFDSVTDNSE